MADIDTHTTRILADAHDPMCGYTWPHGTIHALCDEIDSLRARLAEVEAERDRNKEMWDLGLRLLREVEARLAEVEAERDAAIAGSREIRGALLAAEARLAEVLAKVAYIASQPCQTSTTGRCDRWRVPGAEYTADRTCNPCIARAAIACEGNAEPAGNSGEGDRDD